MMYSSIVGCRLCSEGHMVGQARARASAHCSDAAASGTVRYGADTRLGLDALLRTRPYLSSNDL